MGRKTKPDSRGDMMQGTLDMLILKTVLFGPAHGHTIAHVIEKTSEEVLQVEHGSLYPALYRLEDQGLIASFWGTSRTTGKLSITGSRRPEENTWRRSGAAGTNWCRPLRGCWVRRRSSHDAVATKTTQ